MQPTGPVHRPVFLSERKIRKQDMPFVQAPADENQDTKFMISWATGIVNDGEDFSSSLAPEEMSR